MTSPVIARMAGDDGDVGSDERPHAQVEDPLLPDERSGTDRLAEHLRGQAGSGAVKRIGRQQLRSPATNSTLRSRKNPSRSRRWNSSLVQRNRCVSLRF